MTSRAQQACPRPAELERSYWERDGSLDNHRASCSDCARAWDEISSLADLAKTLPPPQVSAERREHVRTALLASPVASTLAPRRLRSLAVAGAVIGLAAAIALYLALAKDDQVALSIANDQPTQPQYRGTVSGVDGQARFSVSSALPDEVVRLASGSIDVKVATLGPGERFRVVTGDAEIEVRGTAFRVTADNGKLVAVAVSEGRVIVRAAAEERTLRSGERWELLAMAPPPPPVIEQPTNDSRLRPEPAAGETPRATKSLQDRVPEKTAPRAMSDYERGWSHLREKRYVEAAADFERAISSPGHQADALYWASVSHFRGGKRERARVLLRRFLRDHASHARRAEVAVMLGWIEVDRQDFEAARELFELGNNSARSAKVRKSAEAGLEAVGAKRQ